MMRPSASRPPRGLLRGDSAPLNKPLARASAPCKCRAVARPSLRGTPRHNPPISIGLISTFPLFFPLSKTHKSAQPTGGKQHASLDAFPLFQKKSGKRKIHHRRSEVRAQEPVVENPPHATPKTSPEPHAISDGMPSLEWSQNGAAQIRPGAIKSGWGGLGINSPPVPPPASQP